MGFHDGISNIPSKDRYKAIAIPADTVEYDDQWGVSGTYMGVIRIEINLHKWQKKIVEMSKK